MSGSDAAQLADRWTVDELPALNRAILRGSTPPGALAQRLSEEVLRQLPLAAEIAAVPAMRLLVLLSLAGASIARHYQERHGTDEPERAFDPVRVGPDALGFLDYFGELGGRTDTGHPDRDSYTGLVRWNVPCAEVSWQGRTLAVIDGVFDDAGIRTYTGTVGEETFFEVLKQGECLEKAVNALLAPVATGAVEFASDEAVERVRAATTILHVLRRLMLDYPHLPDGGAMTPSFFMDVFRQFAVHWRPGDLPPSGAMDTEALTRDLLLGINYTGYPDALRRLFPALLRHERQDLRERMGQPSTTQSMLKGIGVTPTDLASMPLSRQRALVAAHPELVTWFDLLQANGRSAAAHLGLSKKMLFNPQRRRELADVGGNRPVANDTGTTGMTEHYLAALTAARKSHALLPLHLVVGQVLRPSCEDRLDEVTVTVNGRPGRRP
ncbi:hypothetical protein [Pilimelia columellifera]|uniref:hypothetical protein n=1 Tax=Pilimelia columellifera TaxID=706574 RepID=UPI0031D08C36